jgi:hypothetical protein
MEASNDYIDPGLLELSRQAMALEKSGRRFMAAERRAWVKFDTHRAAE